MTIKEYLNQAFHFDQRINSKLDMLSKLKEMATKTNTIMQNNAVSHARDVHEIDGIIAKIVDMQSEIKADIEELINKKQEIILTIHSVNNPEHQTLLELRYICFHTWEEIADQMHCTVSNVYKVHAKALQEIKVPKLGS